MRRSVTNLLPDAGMWKLPPPPLPGQRLRVDPQRGSHLVLGEQGRELGDAHPRPTYALALGPQNPPLARMAQAGLLVAIEDPSIAL